MPNRVVGRAQRRAEIMVATLFLVTAAVAIGGVLVLDPILKAPDFMARVFPHRHAVVWGALLWSINNIGIVFIAVFLFPLLKRLDEAVAVGVLATRIVEGAVMMVGIASTLLLIPLSREFIEAGAPQDSWFQTMGNVLLQLKLLGLTNLSLPLLGLGGVLFTWLLFRHRLVPRAISVVGLFGYCVIFFGGIAAWFGLVDASPGGSATFLAIPVAAFEILLLPFWLYLRGFEMPGATRAEEISRR